jgi:hypothetical protein
MFQKRIFHNSATSIFRGVIFPRPIRERYEYLKVFRPQEFFALDFSGLFIVYCAIETLADDTHEHLHLA